MAQDLKHLWEFEHPYYCASGCYYVSSYPSGGECHQRFESWEDFIAEWADSDDDYNLLFRFDWHPAEHFAEDDEPTNSDMLELRYFMQRKARPFSVDVKVNREQEPAIRAWLQERFAHLMKLWSPFSKDVTP